jgi:inner membrane protein
MDSGTQFILGAAVAEASLLGPKAGRWWRFWLGGLVGTLPDLDVLCAPWLDGPTGLGFHRGVTHSLFFCTLVTPLLAWLLQRLFASKQISWGRWNLFVWLGLNTHWMIDSLTNYGTQVFLPFSDYPVSISSVFIIDPLYTSPLLACLLLSIRRGGPKAVTVGLVLSTAYLFLTLGSKYAVQTRFERSLKELSLEYRQLMTVPTPFNSILWYGYVDLGDTILVSDSSLLDSPDRPIVWQAVPKNRELLKDLGSGRAEQRLEWFSRGFYKVELLNGKPIWTDLRFGRLKSWLQPVDPDGEDYIYRFALLPDRDHGPYDDFRHLRPQGGLDQFPWRLFLRRILGLEIPQQNCGNGD